MDDTKKQIKLESVKVQEATSKKNQETLSGGTLIKGILKLAGRWIPENSSKELSEEEMFNITFRDADHDKNRAKKIISSEVHHIHSIIENFTISKDQSNVVAKTDLKLLDSINKCFLALAIEPVTKDFFTVVLGNESLKSNTSFENHVKKFNILSMYFFGNFEQAYKNLRNVSPEEIKKYYNEIFPDKNEVERRIKKYTDERLPFDDIQDIKGWDLWCLGYLARSYLSSINENRKKLLPLLKEAKTKGISDGDAFDKMAKGKHIEGFDFIIPKAALDHSSKPYGVYNFYHPFSNRLENAIKVCEKEVTGEYIDNIRETGRQNTATYLALNDIDVYVATSMRNPSHFTTTKMLIKDLFDIPEIEEMNLRYFDPTQSFSHDRIDKGLIECLMIKRARVTIYNAQESDTFGKDSEAAVTLAERGDVIVYIARLFCNQSDPPEFKKLYEDIDKIMVMDDDSEGVNKIIDFIRKKNYAKEIELQGIIKPGTGKTEIITLMIQNKGWELLKNHYKDEKKLKEILDSTGYEDFPQTPPISFLLPLETSEAYMEAISGNKWTYQLFALCTMINLEKRALVFKEGHPLSLQTSPEDGIARGVIITRDIPTTAKVLKALLCRTLDYNIEYGKYACLLRDAITTSPVRVITKDKNLTVAFWSKHEEGRKKFKFSDLE